MNKPSVYLIISTAALFAFGLLMIFNTTAAQVMDRSSISSEGLQECFHSMAEATHITVFKQLIYGVVGLISGIMMYRFGYEAFLRWSVFGLILGIFLLVLVFVPGIGQTVNGANRWIGIFGYTFQPSECIKILIPAVHIRWALQKTDQTFLDFCKILVFFSLPMGLILVEPDNGSTIIILVLLLVLFLLTQIRWYYWILPLLVLVCAGGAAAYRMPHVHDRMQIYMNPELDLKGKGHQPHQAKIAAGSGGLFGRGLGESLQKLNYLPEARNDYIAAIFAEETGFVGVLSLIALYMTLTFSGFLIAMRSSDKGGFLLAAALTFLISFQAFLNLGIVSGLLPSKGMTLPFFSQGGTSLMINMIALFLLLDISRKTVKKFHEV